MPIDCKALFDQAWMRVEAIPGIKTLSQTPLNQVSAEHLPHMMMTMDTEMSAWGDPTAGPPTFDATITFYFSLLMTYSDEQQHLNEMNAIMDMVETVLLTDPVFLKQVRGWTGMRRQNPIFNNTYETNIGELRQSISFLMHQIMFLPTLIDDFKTIGIVGKPAPQVDDGSRPPPPTIYREWKTFGDAFGSMQAAEMQDSADMTGNIT
jgi:hypothetical protein